ncbi:MAG: hypothetical protein HQK56_15390 [Deltaproteobacteria bacterium]|nr:hypothetical protein [Deltaproteobacteria bacterium]
MLDNTDFICSLISKMERDLIEAEKGLESRVILGENFKLLNEDIGMGLVIASDQEKGNHIRFGSILNSAFFTEAAADKYLEEWNSKVEPKYHVKKVLWRNALKIYMNTLSNSLASLKEAFKPAEVVTD